MNTPAHTATLDAARAHARSQARTQSATQATIPSTEATDLPPGVSAADVCWDETLAVGGYTALTLARHGRLRLSDLEGDTCTGMLVYNAQNTAERLNVADTVKVQWQTYLTSGAVLLSDLGRALMTITADTSERHDALCGGTTKAANERRYGDGALHSSSPAARELFTVAGARHGLARRDLPPSLNLFKSARVEGDGTLRFNGSQTAPTYIELRADLDVLVLIVNSPHPLDDRSSYTTTTLRLTAWNAAPPPDPIAAAVSPERVRAYENSLQYVIGATR